MSSAEIFTQNAECWFSLPSMNAETFCHKNIISSRVHVSEKLKMKHLPRCCVHSTRQGAFFQQNVCVLISPWKHIKILIRSTLPECFELVPTTGVFIFTTLWANSAEDKLMTVSYFSGKQDLTLKCQILFSGQNKKNSSKCLLKILPRVLCLNVEIRKLSRYPTDLELNSIYHR